MNFDEFRFHIEGLGCVVDHFEDDVYYATNMINMKMCQIQSSEKYSEVSISHYCFQLGVSPPEGEEQSLDPYIEMRKDLARRVKEEDEK